MAAVWSSLQAPRRAADLAAGRALLRSGSRSFHLASLLLPRDMREAATALYAFCRLADDAIDGGGDAAGAEAQLAQLRRQLDRVYDAALQPQQPVERLLSHAVRQYRIPRALLDALLEGFAWDLAGRRYETLPELNAYAARVAGSVGTMMTLLMGVRDPAVLARACDLGVAMQLTNIARDVGQDARAGRVYLPLSWLREAGVAPESLLAQPQFSPALGGVIERLLRAADELYDRSVAGIGHLPTRAQPGVHAARLLYAQIGADLRRHGLDALRRRAHVGASRKFGLLLAALAASLRTASAAATPVFAPLNEVDFLLSAVRDSLPGAEQFAVRDGARAPEQSRTEWLLELFERLQRRQQLTVPAGAAAVAADAP